MLVATTTDIVIEYDSVILAGSSSVSVKRVKDDSIFETISSTSTQISIASSSATISLSQNLEPGAMYYLHLQEGFVAKASNTAASLESSSTLSFATVDDLFQIELVKDINPGSGDSYPDNFTLFKGEYYFSAEDGTNGIELWRSDGTTSGTEMVKDINPGSGDSDPQDIFEYNDHLYFSADDGANGGELWRTDGTSSGTEMVKDINDSGNSYPTDYVVYDDKLYFSADDGANGRELWRTDGTASGTEMVKDINPGSGSSYPLSNGDILIDPARVVLEGEFYFSADDGANGDELWKSDGTASGTVLVADINPGGDSYPQYLIKYNNEIYFAAYDSAYDQEFWKYSTSSGASRVKDIRPGDNSSPGPFFEVNGYLLFGAIVDVPSYMRAFYRSDGTASGTVRIGSSSLETYSESVVDGVLYYEGEEVSYRSDGTTSGTYVIADVCRPDGMGIRRPWFTGYDGDVYFFSGNNSPYGVEIWKSYGLASSSFIVKDETGGSEGLMGDHFSSFSPLVHNGYLYFSADNKDSVGKELFRAYNIQTPTSTSRSASGISASAATLNGTLVYKGRVSSLERGFVYSSSTSTPTVDNGSTVLSSSSDYATGTYSRSLSSLSCGTTYYYRAFAKTKAGYGYGDVVSFTTSACTCPTLAHATAYNSYPTCGASACESGYHVSGSGASAVCEADGGGGSPGGGSPGGGGGSLGRSAQPITGDFGLEINDDSQTTASRMVYLTFDTGGENVTHIQVREGDDDLSTTTKQAYTGALPFMLSSGSGEKTIYARLWVDVYDYSVDIISDTITYANSTDPMPSDSDSGSQGSSDSGDAGSGAGSVKILKSGKNTRDDKTRTDIPLYELTDDDIVCTQAVLTPEQQKKRWREADEMKSKIEEKIASQTNETQAGRQKRLGLERRLKGKILLQVEENGEAWYLNPDNDRRYFLGRPLDMFKIMRAFGLGAKHDYIANNEYFPDRLLGKILIDVEDEGRAYYINPENRRKYYLACPSHAFWIVRALGLGISNTDLDHIWVDRVPADS